MKKLLLVLLSVTAFFGVNSLSKVNIHASEEITDLTGTKWRLEAGWTATSGFGQFDIQGTVTDSSAYIEYNGTIDRFYIGYVIDFEEFKPVPTSNYILTTFVPTYLTPERYYEFEFTGGADVTNPTLIAWLQANGTLVALNEPELPPISDVSGYIWIGNDIIDLTNNFSYNINFYSNSKNFIGLMDDYGHLNYIDADSEDNHVFLDDRWIPSEYRWIHIIDGDDVTNIDLIFWLIDNGNLIAPEQQKIKGEDAHYIIEDDRAYLAFDDDITLIDVSLEGFNLILEPSSLTLEIPRNAVNFYIEDAEGIIIFDYNNDTPYPNLTDRSVTYELYAWTGYEFYLELIGEKHHSSYGGIMISLEEGFLAYDIQEIYQFRMFFEIDESEVEISKYTVTFDTNGGSLIAPIVVDENEHVIVNNPTKSGYTFVGWYIDAALTQTFNIVEDVITSDTTLYAKWVLSDTGNPSTSDNNQVNTYNVLLYTGFAFLILGMLYSSSKKSRKRG